LKSRKKKTKMEEKAGPQRGKRKRDTEHCSQEQCLNYVRFDEDGKPLSARDTQKLVALYHRVSDTALGCIMMQIRCNKSKKLKSGDG
jgi:hypothetical protein